MFNVPVNNLLYLDIFRILLNGKPKRDVSNCLELFHDYLNLGMMFEIKSINIIKEFTAILVRCMEWWDQL